jgi:hypothetical protein
VVEATPEWNKPVLQLVPEIYSNGKWKSEATMMLTGLDALASDENINVENWDLVAKKTRPPKFSSWS